jgi:galactokinase
VRVAPWHLDIDKSELRWESYVKAGYYVCVFALFVTPFSNF